MLLTSLTNIHYTNCIITKTIIFIIFDYLLSFCLTHPSFIAIVVATRWGWVNCTQENTLWKYSKTFNGVRLLILTTHWKSMNQLCRWPNTVQCRRPRSDSFLLPAGKKLCCDRYEKTYSEFRCIGKLSGVKCQTKTSSTEQRVPSYARRERISPASGNWKWED